MNHSTKCRWTAVEPGVPGTRGIKIGARIEPVLMSKSVPAEGRLLRVSSDKGVYAVAVRKAHIQRHRICTKRGTMAGVASYHFNLRRIMIVEGR